MNPFIEQVFSILNTNPGNLAYHLVLAFSAAGALQISLLSWRNAGSLQGSRLALGAGLLLLIRLLLFGAAALAWSGILSISAFPPIDRSATLFGLVLIVWLWTAPARSRLADTAVVLMALLVLTFSALTIAWWSAQDANLAFNSTWPDFLSQVFALLIILYGVFVLLIKRPEGWSTGLACLILLAIGHIAHLLFPLPGSSLPGAVRLAQMAAYPLLLALPQRLVADQKIQTSLEKQPVSNSTSPRFLEPFLILASEKDPHKICLTAAKLTAQLMMADICLYVRQSEESEALQVSCGYNLHTKEEINPSFIGGSLAGNIAAAVRRNRPLRMQSPSAPNGDVELVSSLGLTRITSVLAVPFMGAENTSSGLVVLSAYSNRTWLQEDQNRLADISSLITKLTEQAGRENVLSSEIEDNQNKIQELKTQAEKYYHQNEDLHAELEGLKNQLTNEHTRAENLASRLASRDESQEIIAQLETEIKKLKDQLETQSAWVNLQEGEELRLTLQEIAMLKQELSEANQKLEESQSKPVEPPPVSFEQAEVIASISQELRQPMSSIAGYTDLLLGESAGILGALQRKFLERIKASTERMGGLIEDLVQVSASSNGKPKLQPTTVDLNSVIDDAVALSISQIREKNIVLRVDIPESLPPIVADKDGMQQVLIHLLQNAGSASPVDGEISLHALLKKEDGESDFILLQVSDTGGGIPPEDLPRVFSRLYRADNPLIQGVGDTGVGLSIVKTLVEAHHGRIWVDSEMGRGSTFSILLPVLKDEDQWEPGEGIQA